MVRYKKTLMPVYAVMALLGGGFACILLWCSVGGSLFPRVSPAGLALLILGVLLLVLLAPTSSHGRAA